MNYKVMLEQEFNGCIKKIHFNGIDYFLGIGNLKEDVGMSIYTPQSGCNYIMIMLNDFNYRFHLNEFKTPVGISYFAEKLHCSKEEARMVYDIVRDVLEKDAVFPLLMGEENENKRNPLTNDYIET